MTAAHLHHYSVQGHKHYRDYSDVRGDGAIVLYRRADSKSSNWWVRIKVPGCPGYIVRSLKNPDLDGATNGARKLFYMLEGRALRGEPVRVPTFKRVFEQWKATSLLNPTKYSQANVRKMELGALPFFSDHQIDLITAKTMAEYREWRLRKALKAPAASTLRNEWSLLKQIFELARLTGYITQVPRTRLKAVRPLPRPDISEEEWRRLLEFMPTYVDAARDTWRNLK